MIPRVGSHAASCDRGVRIAFGCCDVAVRMARCGKRRKSRFVFELETMGSEPRTCRTCDEV